MEMNLDINFNINDRVKLRLTEKGLETYVAFFEKSMGSVRRAEEIREGARKEMAENDGFISMIMWQVMGVFGPHLGAGAHQQIVGSRLYLTKYNAILSIEDN